MNRLLILLVLAIAGSMQAQPVRLRGYVLALHAWERFAPAGTLLFGGPRTLRLELLRTRLMPTVRLPGSLRLQLAYEVNLLYASTPNLLSAPADPMRPRQMIKLSARLYHDRHVRVTHYLDRLSLRRSFTWGRLELGRQRIAWGVGRLWNPVDFFNPLAPFEFARVEKNGADAFSLRYYLGLLSDLELVYNPEHHGRWHNVAFRWRTHAGTYDLAFVGAILRRRATVGLTAAGNLGMAGARAELLWEQGRAISLVLGLDHQFAPRWYGLVEYYRNGRGAARPEAYDWLALARGEAVQVGRDELALMLQYELHPLVRLQALHLRNLNDQSFYTGFQLTWLATQAVDLVLGGWLGEGDRLSEYGLLPDVLFLRGRVYF
ncbi:hypothetical protein [Rhodothermus profundi]|uniref:Phosphate-selective porin O and P n=1 Tax=Rhodothermus profundi TaxID=633813 RepID=A0A1M6TL99_9BACT|nr:hypothetical protein [Rhodothermus profundi]SHK57714.1 hypothetical protein SAMN04488087_1442 [Rhodothermus profundi]